MSEEMQDAILGCVCFTTTLVVVVNTAALMRFLPL